MEKEMRLLDANALIQLLRGQLIAKYPFSYYYGLFAAAAEIEKIPAVDAVEVVHGHWEKSPHLWGYVRCSVCHDCNVWDEWSDGKKWGYCPQCGAKMDGGNDNGKE